MSEHLHPKTDGLGEMATLAGGEATGDAMAGDAMAGGAAPLGGRLGHAGPHRRLAGA